MIKLNIFFAKNLTDNFLEFLPHGITSMTHTVSLPYVLLYLLKLSSLSNKTCIICFKIVQVEHDVNPWTLVCVTTTRLWRVSAILRSGRFIAKYKSPYDAEGVFLRPNAVWAFYTVCTRGTTVWCVAALGAPEAFNGLLCYCQISISTSNKDSIQL